MAISAPARPRRRDLARPEVRAVLSAAGFTSESVAEHAELAETACAALLQMSYSPENAAALNGLGVIQKISGRPREASRTLKRAAASAPTAPEVRTNLASALALSGEDSEGPHDHAFNISKYLCLHPQNATRPTTARPRHLLSRASGP